jgi:hypothetical protein
MKWKSVETERGVEAFSLSRKGRIEIAAPVRAWSRLSRSMVGPEGPELENKPSRQSSSYAASWALTCLNKLLSHALTDVAIFMSALRACSLLTAH